MPDQNIDVYDWDLVDLQQLSNSGTEIAAVATLCALDGSLEYINCSHTRSNPQAKVFPAAMCPASAIIWLEEHGLDALTADLDEAMAEQRDWLNGLDVQSEPNIGFVYACAGDS